MRTEENYSLLEHNTFGIDARCRRFVEYDTPEELAQLVGQAPLLHIGGGFCSCPTTTERFYIPAFAQ